MSQIMFQHSPQSQELQPSNCAECSHTSTHDPFPFLLAAHHLVKRPVEAHLSGPVRLSSVRVKDEEREEEGDDDDERSYYISSSYPSPKPKPNPYRLASFSSAESLPSPVLSESSILSSSSSPPSPSQSQVETWPTILSNHGQVRLGMGGLSPSRRSEKVNLQQPHQFYLANMHNPRKQQRQRQQQRQLPIQRQQQRQQRQQAMNLVGKTSGDYEDTPSQGSPSRGTVYTYTSDEIFGDGGSSPHSPKQHTMWILIYLSFLSPFLTLPIALYTLLITPVLILLSPLSLLTTSYPSLHTQLHRFLSPPINAQLDFILSSTTLHHLSSSSDDIDDDDDDNNNKPANTVMLLLVNILSPIYAIGICLSAWVAALFWFYAAILGDPDTGFRGDGRDDGRAAVLGVRRWWEGWLQQAR